MADDAVSVECVRFDDYESSLRDLFAEYHAWNVEMVRREFDTEYDVAATIATDVQFLRESADENPLVGRRGKRVVGCVFLQPMTDAAAEVKRLYVRPSARGLGLGRRLVETLIDAAREAGYETLRLNTGPYTRAARRLYADLGFEFVEPYPGSEIPEEYHDEWTFMELALED